MQNSERISLNQVGIHKPTDRWHWRSNWKKNWRGFVLSELKTDVVLLTPIILFTNAMLNASQIWFCTFYCIYCWCKVNL